MTFPIHTLDTAPEGARSGLERAMARYGFLPNLVGVFAQAPATLTALLDATDTFDGPAMTLSPAECQVVLLAVSVRNRCEYCTAAHSMLATMAGVDRSTVDDLQQGHPLADGRLNALRHVAEALVDKRGWLDEVDLDRFAAAGFGQPQMLEVILGVSLKTLTNYANHVARPAVNAEFAAFIPNWRVAATTAVDRVAEIGVSR